MIEIKKKSDCCGCTACAAICPKDAIIMKEDNEGFLYPTVDKETCINCGVCERVCPIKYPIRQQKRKDDIYYIQCKDENIRSQSTSGGMFTALAEFVIKKEGAVFGCAFQDASCDRVVHKMAEDMEDIHEFRGSKYVQSDVNNTYRQAKKCLKENRLVCYSGTPCQIAGLKKYLGRDYENLITVDVVCRAVPSPFVWKKYVEVFNKNTEIK